MGAQQLSLFGRAEEARMYHDARHHGFFSLLVRPPEGKIAQSSHRLSELATVLSMIDPNRDTWISQAEFMKPNRRVVNLARIGLLFADLDTYNVSSLATLSPDRLAQEVLSYCADEGIPTPSFLIFSGRGIQAKWLLTKTLPRFALPRWNACQRHLVDRLTALGADQKAKDASRVLRVVNTVNEKSGLICYVVHVENGGDGQPIRYDFEYLAGELLPFDRASLKGLRLERQKRSEQRQLRLYSGGKSDNLRGFSGRQLAWHRLEDLRMLATLRGGVQEGERMLHLFWRLNFLLLSGASNSSLMYHEARALATELDAAWGYRSEELMTLYSKAKSYEAGEKVSFAGKEYAPLYTPKNDTLINLFQITDEEQRQLRTIISPSMARERDKDRKTAARRAAGVVDRETYEAQSLSKQKPWEALGMSRSTWYRAGKPSAPPKIILPGDADFCI